MATVGGPWVERSVNGSATTVIMNVAVAAAFTPTSGVIVTL